MTYGNPLLSVASIALLVGLAVGGLLYALLIFSDEHQNRVAARVRKYLTRRPRGSGRLLARGLRSEGVAWLDARWRHFSQYQSIHQDIQAAGVNWLPTEVVLMQLGAGLALTLVAWLLVPAFGLLLAPVCILVGVLSIRFYLRRVAKRRIARFDDQLPDNLAVLAGSVRGGFSLFQALQMIAREAAEPSKSEYVRVIQEISLGSPMSDALEGLARRVPTEDMDILVTAISMQQTTGGNLTHVLEVVATTVRERHRIKREIKSLTAQQRFSAILLSALPFLLGGVLIAISPKYMSHMFQWSWVLCMPTGAFVMCVVGFFVMRKMADIDV